MSDENVLNEPLVSIISLTLNDKKYKDYVNIFIKHLVNKNDDNISLLSNFDENKDIQYHLVYISKILGTDVETITGYISGNRNDYNYLHKKALNKIIKNYKLYTTIFDYGKSDSYYLEEDIIKYCAQNTNTIYMFKNLNNIFSKYNLKMPIYILNTQNYKIKGCNLKTDYKYYLNNSNEVFATLGDIKYEANLDEKYIKNKTYHSIYTFVNIKSNGYDRIFYYKDELLLQDKLNDFIDNFYNSLTNII